MGITLEFHMGVALQVAPVLSRVLFFQNNDLEPRVSVRGKTGGPLYHHGTFQWTKAVKGLSVLLLRAAVRGVRNDSHGEALLVGGGGTLASSLTYAIDKEPCWLTEMFGSNAVGYPYCKRLFLRNNPALRMGAPVALGLNPHVLRNDEITIILNEETLTDPEAITEISEAISGEHFKNLECRSREPVEKLSRVA